jgi:hypothetical protein
MPHHKVIVAVFTMAGCGACEEYKPRFRRVVQEMGLPVFDVGKGRLPDPTALSRTCLPVYTIDCDDKQFGNWAEHLNVHATPSTYVLRRPRGVLKLEGSIPDEQVKWLLGKALRGLTCEL